MTELSQGQATWVECKKINRDLAFARKVRDTLDTEGMDSIVRLRAYAVDLDIARQFEAASLLRAIASALEAEQEAADA